MNQPNLPKPNTNITRKKFAPLNIHSNQPTCCCLRCLLKMIFIILRIENCTITISLKKFSKLSSKVYMIIIESTLALYKYLQDYNGYQPEGHCYIFFHFLKDILIRFKYKTYKIVT